MKRAAWQRRKAMLHLAEATLARYETIKGRARSHPPDFNAMMMRICAGIVENRDKNVPPAERCDPVERPTKKRGAKQVAADMHAMFEAGGQLAGARRRAKTLGKTTGKVLRDDGPTHADEDASRMEMFDTTVDETPYGGEDGEP